MSNVLTTPDLMTADEYGRLGDDGRYTDLVRGRIVERNRPVTSHGYFMNRVAYLLTQIVHAHRLGQVVAGDAGVVTTRNPDSVRGPDVAYYSYQRIPPGPLPEGYWPASPELVVEVRSRSDRWKDVVVKVAEYLNADVLVVAVVDPESRRVHIYSANNETTILNADDRLTFPEILPGFESPVSTLFE